MKKYVIGAIIGIMLSTSYSVSAEVINMIGKKVDGSYPFKINGKRATQDVIVIEGASYVPVRAAADLFGYDIDFDKVNKEVHMQSKKFKGLSDFEKAFRSSFLYDLKTEVLGLNGSEGRKVEVLLSLDEFYIPASSLFSNLAEYDGTTMSIPFNGKTIYGTKDSPQNGDLVFAAGSFYVKLSALGLKATVQGDTLVIEAQP